MHVAKTLGTLKQALLNLFFPIHCLSCKQEGAWLCRDCLATVTLREIQVCPVCRQVKQELGQTCQSCRNKTALQGIFVVSEAGQKNLRKLVHHFKYNSFSEISTVIGSLFLRNFTNSFLSTQDIILIPVPLHPRRERWRGFNQATLLAYFLGSYTNLKVITNLLLRTRFTKPQMKLKRQDRLDNLKDAFELHGTIEKHKTYLLIDDILTTGSTLEACAKVLKQAGAR